MTTNDKLHVENAISFIQQARQENLTAAHAIAKNLGPGASEAHKANINAAAMWDAALRELKTYLGGWHTLNKPPNFRQERRCA
jgi:hypothetical protein